MKKVRDLCEWKILREEIKKIELPCGIDDIIYKIDTAKDSDGYIAPTRVDNIVFTEDEILYKADPYDDIICTNDNLINKTKYLEDYEVFLGIEEAKKSLLELGITPIYY